MNSKVRAIVEFMHDNLQQRCTLRQFAEIARLSERQVIELFQAEFQLPPCAYFKNLRLEKASKLLADSALPVKEVRYVVGYQDASDFTRDFKKSMVSLLLIIETVFTLVITSYRNIHRNFDQQPQF